MGGCAPKMYIHPSCLSAPLSHREKKKFLACGDFNYRRFRSIAKGREEGKGVAEEGGKGALKVGAGEERAFYDESAITISPLFIRRVLSLVVVWHIFFPISAKSDRSFWPFFSPGKIPRHALVLVPIFDVGGKEFPPCTARALYSLLPLFRAG